MFSGLDQREARSFALNASRFNAFFGSRAHKGALYAMAEAVADAGLMTPSGVVGADAVRSALRAADGSNDGGGRGLAKSFDDMLDDMQAGGKAWRAGPDGGGDMMVELPRPTRAVPARAKVEL